MDTQPQHSSAPVSAYTQVPDQEPPPAVERLGEQLLEGVLLTGRELHGRSQWARRICRPQLVRFAPIRVEGFRRSAISEDRFTVSRTIRTGVLWCRFGGQEKIAAPRRQTSWRKIESRAAYQVAVK